VARVSGRETWFEVVGVRVVGNLGEAELAVVRSLALCT